MVATRFFEKLKLIALLERINLCLYKNCEMIFSETFPVVLEFRFLSLSSLGVVSQFQGCLLRYKDVFTDMEISDKT